MPARREVCAMTTDRHRPDVRDACRTLGVSPSDDLATIRAAWRDLVRSHHPDRGARSKENATAKLAAINDAWDTLFNHKSCRAPATRATDNRLAQCSPNVAPARPGGSARPVSPGRTRLSADASNTAEAVRRADGAGRTPRRWGHRIDGISPEDPRKQYCETREALHGYSKARKIWENLSALPEVKTTA